KNIIKSSFKINGDTAKINFSFINKLNVFENTSSGNINSLLWDFGDGATTQQFNAAHSYTEHKSYKITLTISDAASQQDSSIHYLLVKDTTFTQIQADFFTESNTINLYNTGKVRFYDMSKGKANEWLWDFGDASSTSTEQNPFHTFSSVGDFNVTLKVSNQNGSDEITRKISVINVKAIKENNAALHKVIVSPNPCVNFVIVKSEKPIDNIEVFDVFGRLLLKTEVNDNYYLLNTTNFIKTMFFIRLHTNDLITTCKVVVKK
ncbi:MAG: PKD domain-containing protein, partial [Bacteroidales bacterium]|nr:PKD domain-containing protein [Bacteroidales bacterium]